MDKALSGIFYDPAQPGCGLMLQVSDKAIAGAFYGHDRNGEQVYMVFGVPNDGPRTIELQRPRSTGFPVGHEYVNQPAGTIEIQPFPGNLQRMTVVMRLQTAAIDNRHPVDIPSPRPSAEQTFRFMMDRLV